METLDNTIRIAGLVKESIVDGPGFRYVVFTQGCPHKCEDCHNPQTHDYNGGKLVSISNLVEDIVKNPLIKGVTISGGEPFVQAKNVVKLLNKLDLKKYDVMIYTGFLYEDLIKNANDDNGFLELLKLTDILIDGKFDKNLKSENVPFRGSTNQKAIEAKNSINKGTILNHEF